MADRTKEARSRRTEARDRRRASVEEPFEELDQAAREQAEGSTSSNSDFAGAAAKIVGTAAAAALLGALGGAAKALFERRGGEEPQTPEEPEHDDGDDAVPEDAARADSAPQHEEEDDREEPSAVAEQDRGAEEEPADAEMEDEPPGSAQVEHEGATRDHVQGVSTDEGAEIVTQARRQLGTLLGTEAERVSGLERVDGGWSVMLEVVEVSRVPESTDVLATYELALDDDRNLVSVSRRRRYRRAQIDDAS